MAERSKSERGGFGISHDWSKGGLGYRAGRSPFYNQSTEVSSALKGALYGVILSVRWRVSSPRNYLLYNQASYSRSKGYTPGISPWLDRA